MGKRDEVERAARALLDSVLGLAGRATSAASDENGIDRFFVRAGDLGLVDADVVTLRAALALPDDVARRPASRDEVAAYIHAVAAHDATLPAPTDEQIDGVWDLVKHPATTMLSLAVTAWERGQSYARLRALPLPAAPSTDEVEVERDAMLDWLDERVGDGRGVVTLGLTDNGGVGCWLPGDETVPEGESVEEAIRFRMERDAAERAERAKGGDRG